MATSKQPSARGKQKATPKRPAEGKRVKSPPSEPVQEAPAIAPDPVPMPPSSGSDTEAKAVGGKRKGPLLCAVCGKVFERSKNLRKKAKVCTPFDFNHKAKFEKQPDGQVKKIACACCRCLYKKSLAKNRTLDGKLIPLGRVPEFLAITKEAYPEVLLAFRTGLNAMLRVTEIASLEVGDLEENAKPLPRLKILALKKTVKMYFPVDIDPNLARELRAHVAGKTEGKIFDIPVRTLQHKFTQVMKRMGLDLSIHALRHTGISNRARTCKTMDELNYLRVQARHESIETTKLYMGFEDHQRLEMASRVSWF